jgi:general secretion pathway protein G
MPPLVRTFAAAPGSRCAAVPPCATDAGRSGRRRRGGARRAFTLIEILAVVVIMGALMALAIPRFQDMVNAAKVARAIGDIQALEIDLASGDTLPTTLAGIGRGGMLDPWGHPYVYYKFPPPKSGQSAAPPSGARKDRFLVPVNSTYDLYSMGADGKTAVAFTSAYARDDVVRANDGGYVGLAGRY